MGSKKIFIQLENGSQVQVKWFEPANREDIEHSIRQAAGLTKSARFQLTDDEGDIIVLSSSIPNGTKLELHTIKAARASQTRKHAKMDSSDDGGPVPRKRLRSGTRDVKEQVVQMGFELADVERSAQALGRQQQEVSVSNLLKALVQAERAMAAASSPSARNEEEEEDDSSVCCICLDGFQNKALFITECGHKYHFNCIKKYCEKGKEEKSSCPLCRQMLPTPPGQSKRAARRNSAGGRGREERGSRAAAAQQPRAQNPVVGNEGSAPPQIEEWKYVFNTGVVKGEVYNYPGHEDAAPISTSQVARAEGVVFFTSSGSRYQLGQPDPAFRQQLETLNLYNEDDPLVALLPLTELPTA